MPTNSNLAASAARSKFFDGARAPKDVYAAEDAED